MRRLDGVSGRRGGWEADVNIRQRKGGILWEFGDLIYHTRSVGHENSKPQPLKPVNGES